MNELIRMRFHAFALLASVLAFGRPAEDTLPARPPVRRILEPYISLRIPEDADRIPAVWVLAAIEAAP